VLSCIRVPFPATRHLHPARLIKGVGLYFALVGTLSGGSRSYLKQHTFQRATHILAIVETRSLLQPCRLLIVPIRLDYHQKNTIFFLTPGCYPGTLGTNDFKREIPASRCVALCLGSCSHLYVSELGKKTSRVLCVSTAFTD
jgi:hypothetical protein